MPRIKGFFMVRTDSISLFDILAISSKNQVTTDDVKRGNPIVKNLFRLLDTLTRSQWGIGEIICACRIIDYYRQYNTPFHISEIRDWFAYEPQSAEAIMLKRILSRFVSIGYFRTCGKEGDIYWNPRNWFCDVDECVEKFGSLANDVIEALNRSDMRSNEFKSGFQGIPNALIMENYGKEKQTKDVVAASAAEE